MNKDKKKIFCIIPALNEEKNIAKVVREVSFYVDKVIVIDDGSEDETTRHAEKEGAIVLKHAINRGQGASLQTGNCYALDNGADIIVHFDADGQFVAEEILEMVEPILKDEAQIVFGSRFLQKKSKIPWFKKNIIMPIARLTNILLAGAKLSDPQSGFRALSKEAAHQITINHDRMAHCSEIIFQSFNKKLIIKEVPITVIYYNFGQKFSGGIRIFKDLLLGKFID